MGALGSQDFFAMDDPLTPLHVPAGNSFDLEFHQRSTVTPPPNMDKFESCIADDFELPADWEQVLETMSFVEEQFAWEGSNLLPSDCYVQQPAPPESVKTIPVTDQQQEISTDQQDEATIMDFDQLMSLSDMGEQMQAQQTPPSLQLDLGLANAKRTEADEVTTPVLIQLLLENEALAEREPAIPAVVTEVKNEPVDSPKPSTSKCRPSKGKKSEVSDLRRVRNNIASKKSRQNRRNKFLMQKIQVDELEAGNKKLEQQIRQLEALRDELMKFITPKNNG